MELFGFIYQNLKIIKMEEKEENKEKNYKQIGIGIEMLDLINIVRKKFQEEYGFKPSIIDMTNLIARRVIDNKLF